MIYNFGFVHKHFQIDFILQRIVTFEDFICLISYIYSIEVKLLLYNSLPKYGTNHTTQLSHHVL